MLGASRLTYLDGLRGVLALIVFIHHFIYAFCPHIIFGGAFPEFVSSEFSIKRFVALTPVNIVFNPGFAIQFFFLVSGYVQCRRYFKTPELQLVQKSFLKRYFRLAIPTLAVLLLVYLFHQLQWINKSGIPVNKLSSSWLAAMLPNDRGFFGVLLLGVFESFFGKSAYYSVLWTMPYELYFSFMVLILLMLTHQVQKKLWVFVFWLVAQLVFMQSYYGAAFTIGLLLAYSEIHLPALHRLLSNRFVKLFCFVGGLYFASYPFTSYQNAAAHSIYAPISFFDTYPHIISYLVGTVLLFCGLLHTPGLQKFFSSKLLIFFGSISFMFYLLHFLVLFSFSPWLFRLLLSSGSAANVGLLICCSLSLLVVALLSWLFYRLVDEPALQFCNKWIRRFFDVRNNSGTRA